MIKLEIFKKMRTQAVASSLMTVKNVKFLETFVILNKFKHLLEFLRIIYRQEQFTSWLNRSVVKV